MVEDFAEFDIPEREYNQTAFTTSLFWSLVNGSQSELQLEIPDWAHYYQIHITKNLETRFYIQCRSYGAAYAKKNADGTLDYSASAYATNIYAVAIDMSGVYNAGIGYSYNAGDRIKVWTPSATFNELSVLGVDGKYLLAEPVNLGTLNSTSYLFFEVYTPYRRINNEPFFETGDMYAITNPGLPTRQYSVVTGQINGDTYTIQRQDAGATNYIVEAMSPNDTVWQNWETDTGWPTFVDDIGQVRRTHTIVWSNTWIAGTKINALNKFELLSEKSVDFQCGAIQKLLLTSKSAEQGTVMLAICTRQTSSCYLGEVQLVGATSNAFVAQTQDVIGTITVLKRMLGTQHPETVIEYLGLGFWLDANNGAVVQYSANGLDTPSAFKTVRFWDNYLKEYSKMSKTNLSVINGFWQMHLGIDPFRKELFAVLPGLIFPNYAPSLPSYTSVPAYASDVNDRFDLFDRMAKTVHFDIVGNKWVASFETTPEWTEYGENDVYSWKDGALYKHNDDTQNWNTFYGEQLPVRICCAWNIPGEPSAIKDILGVQVEGNAKPDFAVAMSSYPWVQITDLSSGDFDDEEGVFFATWLRDRLSPNTSGDVLKKLYAGDIVKSDAPKIMLEFRNYTKLIYINFVGVGFDLSRGTRQLLTQ